jgi:hypothetical protein
MMISEDFDRCRRALAADAGLAAIGGGLFI